MTNCPLYRNGNGHLECADCHWIYKGKAEHPRRPCTNSPALNSPEHRAAIKAKILAELEPLDIPNDLTTIAEQLDRCMVCELFNGRTCTYRGSVCRMRKQWVEFLALMGLPCGKFAEKSPDQRADHPEAHRQHPDDD